MAIQEKFRKVIRKSQLISLGDRVLVAVSGGPDSVALLHVLYNLQDELGLHLEVAHLEHGIRGEEAKDDARFVRELAERLNLPVHVKEVSIPRLRSQAGRGNLEELARLERYALLRRSRAASKPRQDRHCAHPGRSGRNGAYVAIARLRAKGAWRDAHRAKSLMSPALNRPKM